ncbi:carbohydrate ABC transporter permease [Planococcus sp. N028]|uniref:Carbohydrate ABC transporter permease n=1 Tax=Planococcus shixiaomingii TaxID=3058393 RepID=A0ABT8N4S2_9BACL|nr:carbohydrate ABC transporter permease [Planococcus sp. N028]MDN7242886.1 carbohydrate ABC transporter permease [Planococcus sp. N028]
MKVLKWIYAIFLTLLIVFPFYWVAISSFKLPNEILQPDLFPNAWTLQHYKELLVDTPYLINLKNSFIVSLGTMLITVLIVVPASYAIYRMDFKGRDFFYKLILATYIFPAMLLLVPVYQLMSTFNLVDSLWGLIIINVTFAAPFATWLMSGFFKAIPTALDESAAIDGAGTMRILFSIILPLIAPGLATIAIYAFVVSWTEFTFASILIASEESQVLSVGLSQIMGQYTVKWGWTTAGAMLTLLPVLVFFAFAGKYFVKGLTEGSVK